MCGTWDEIEYLNDSLIEGDIIDATIPNDWRTNYQSVRFENLRGSIGTIFLEIKFQNLPMVGKMNTQSLK